MSQRSTTPVPPQLPGGPDPVNTACVPPGDFRESAQRTNGCSPGSVVSPLTPKDVKDFRAVAEEIYSRIANRVPTRGPYPIDEGSLEALQNANIPPNPGDQIMITDLTQLPLMNGWPSKEVPVVGPPDVLAQIKDNLHRLPDFVRNFTSQVKTFMPLSPADHLGNFFRAIGVPSERNGQLITVKSGSLRGGDLQLLRSFLPE